MNPPNYRITGIHWANQNGERSVVMRRNGTFAFYLELEHAKRGLTGFRGNNRDYADLQIEYNTGDWRVQP